MARNERVLALYRDLHAMPEAALNEVKTSTYLAKALREAGFAVRTGVGGTGVTGVLSGPNPGPTLALRADMDALIHMVDGHPRAIHSCGHDANSAMLLAAAEEAARRGLGAGRLMIVFQPAEEILAGALKMIEDGLLADVDILLGMHLRPIQEARRGQATPALHHGASFVLTAVIEGKSAHGARHHLGINAVDAAAAVVNAVNAIRSNPVVPWSAKVTRLQAGGTSFNTIPDRAELALDLRCQDNALMEELIAKATRAVEAGAATVGATAKVAIRGGVPGAEFHPEAVELAREAIVHVLGPAGLLAPITTPGGEDFHSFIKRKPGLKAGYIGLGCDLTPGLHDPGMRFDLEALADGAAIHLRLVEKVLGFRA